ncbi:hypothetical protein ITJ66_07215 [Plantibacter sp. VKM Ac-2885]|uniref:hypothetical protein n=1 Tax=Plantibacter sp. VKM Ac-2885 TaxID=2783828 RepID=UPI00188A2217|nr:hypothetical protein [Plantibacter sp. VKM Ac-2885]MBF4512277.1 hypothetical protein [Plantibacter sp. VKM Ac-2885]
MVIEPEQVLMATGRSIVSLDALGLLSYWATDEIVIDPARLGEVSTVRSDEVRHLFFRSNATADRLGQRRTSSVR